MDNQIYDWLLCNRKNDAQMGQTNLSGLPPMQTQNRKQQLTYFNVSIQGHKQSVTNASTN